MGAGEGTGKHPTETELRRTTVPGLMNIMMLKGQEKEKEGGRPVRKVRRVFDVCCNAIDFSCALINLFARRVLFYFSYRRSSLLPPPPPPSPSS